MLNREQIANTLSRLGLEMPEPLRPTKDLLFSIQYQFTQTVPYENIDILRGIPLSLEEEDLYDKIVTRHRGGYCFEINGFLGMLLRAIGYDVTDYMARYLRGETEIPMRRHRVLIVTCDDGAKYICDAGIGQSAFRYPLPFIEGVEDHQCGEIYRLDRDDFYGWVISDWHHGAWRRFYGFTEEPQLNIDYVMPSFWCEKHPDSPFTSAYMLSIKTSDGRKTLDGNVFRVFAGDEVTEQTLSDAEIPDVLDTVFGIRL
ncbi:MAG: arylamine N-acetyltransferase [Clostridia bacterium]|nr:arylamine N-acetyltransferase [Clostridia bacterium]